MKYLTPQDTGALVQAKGGCAGYVQGWRRTQLNPLMNVRWLAEGPGENNPRQAHTPTWG